MITNQNIQNIIKIPYEKFVRICVHHKSNFTNVD
jgi:sulfur transfer complex TusBCD TusB component (DsrH family)